MRRAVLRSRLAGASLGFADKPLRPRFHHRRMGCNLYRREGRFPWLLRGRRFAAQVQCLDPLSDRPLAVVPSQVSSASVPGGARALANRFSGAATWRARGSRTELRTNGPAGQTPPPGRRAVEPIRERQAASGHGDAEPHPERSRMARTGHPRGLLSILPATMRTASSCDRSRQS